MIMKIALCVVMLVVLHTSAYNIPFHHEEQQDDVYDSVETRSQVPVFDDTRIIYPDNKDLVIIPNKNIKDPVNKQPHSPINPIASTRRPFVKPTMKPVNPLDVPISKPLMPCIENGNVGSTSTRPNIPSQSIQSKPTSPQEDQRQSSRVPVFDQNQNSSNQHLQESLENTNNLVENAMQELTLDLQSLINEPVNSIQSPLSISSLMSMLLLGTSGKTEHELLVGLNYQTNKLNNIHNSYKQIISDVQRSDRGVTLNSATRLFVAHKAEIFKSFTDDALNYYNAKVQAEDFLNKPRETMNHINDWVSMETRGKIPQLLSFPFNPSTKMVATNTVYFNGAWQIPFNEDFTYNRTFKTGTKNITIPFMAQLMTILHIYDKTIDADIIALYYKNREFAMFFVIPKGTSNLGVLSKIENHLNAEFLDTLISNMKIIDASVRIPRMRLRYKSFLKPAFTELHMRSMFDQQTADFSDMTSSKPLFISDIIHETVLEVTEKGTEAAAVTSVSLDRSGGYKSFTVEKPSILFIRDLPNKVNLFWGRIFEPEPIF